MLILTQLKNHINNLKMEKYLNNDIQGDYHSYQEVSVSGKCSNFIRGRCLSRQNPETPGSNGCRRNGESRPHEEATALLYHHGYLRQGKAGLQSGHVSGHHHAPTVTICRQKRSRIPPTSERLPRHARQLRQPPDARAEDLRLSYRQ